MAFLVLVWVCVWGVFLGELSSCYCERILTTLGGAWLGFLSTVCPWACVSLDILICKMGP